LKDHKIHESQKSENQRIMQRIDLNCLTLTVTVISTVSCSHIHSLSRHYTYWRNQGYWRPKAEAIKRPPQKKKFIRKGEAAHCFCVKKGKGSPYSITERRVPQLIPVLGSQPAGDVSHKRGGRQPLLSARPAVTPATLKRAATSFTAW